MKATECVRENEVFEAVVSERWPDHCAEDLKNHVAACPICRDLAEVSQAVQESYSAARRDASVPSAGIVWWRAELRARREAVRTASRPIKIVQAVAGACAVGVSIGLLRRLDFGPLSSIFVERSLPLFIAIGAAIVLLPVALYFVFSDD